MSDLKLIAFYLPQPHAIPGSDASRGEDFTDWTSVKQARPNFIGHCQPQLPGELGYYDPRLPETRAAQAELARSHGIHGFCYYYYWFNGKRLQHQLLDELVQSGQPDFPFCVCWANENWTRRRDGGNNEALVTQAYSAESERRFIEELLPLFADRRYIQVGGRPLLLVSNAGLLPDPLRATANYRAVARHAGFDDLYLAFLGQPGAATPGDWGFDAAVDFPPDGLRAEMLTDQLHKTNPAFAGEVLDYVSAAADALTRPSPPYPCFRGVMPAWDNTPRLQNDGRIFVNSHPQNYGRWLAGIVEQVKQAKEPHEQIVFINAWNDWGQGCHLEPDAQFGRAYLEATRTALGRASDAATTPGAVGTAPSESTITVNTPLFVETIVSALVGDGLVTKEQADRVRARGDKPLIVVTAPPKSGSTFLANTLRTLTGLREFRLSAAYSTNEHDLHLPALCLMSTYGCVSQLHMKGTFHNAALMRNFGIRPIVLVRRIEDIVVSLYHDLKQKALSPDYPTGAYGYSFVWPDEGAKGLSEERQVDMIIDLAVPWFVNFYASWYRLCEQKAVDALWITYEQMLADKEGTLQRVLQFLGFRDVGPIDPKLLLRRYSTFRDSRVGEGATALSTTQRARIHKLFSYYPTVDFGKYGIIRAG